MVTIYYNNAGAILRLKRGSEDDWMGDAPDGAVGSIEFDRDTNPTLLREINESWAAFLVVGGALQKDGAPVTINPPGERAQDRAQREVIIGKVKRLEALTVPEERRWRRMVSRAAGLIAGEREEKI